MYTLKEKSKGKNNNKMVKKKMKENEPQQKEIPGKCASLNATTFYFCNKKLCAACHLCHNSWIVKQFKLG